MKCDCCGTTENDDFDTEQVLERMKIGRRIFCVKCEKSFQDEEDEPRRDGEDEECW